ncbi:hypothetical protein GYMLUDRAFT_242906 [Collybiopsis luxurians FD-317 M1]|uniref:Uncharacterized protein n=1 Tax=Collybiopsis luxurians FD-317 M1 TaxID=944289 RepID=A0A0D0CZY8_9AGAR|nr:hypothetical protein GYMLUDRAFT_242906 [Collybiopsis luxurians FD-317 M1]
MFIEKIYSAYIFDNLDSATASNTGIPLPENPAIIDPLSPLSSADKESYPTSAPVFPASSVGDLSAPVFPASSVNDPSSSVFPASGVNDPSAPVFLASGVNDPPSPSLSSTVDKLLAVLDSNDIEFAAGKLDVMPSIGDAGVVPVVNDHDGSSASVISAFFPSAPGLSSYDFEIPDRAPGNETLSSKLSSYVNIGTPPNGPFSPAIAPPASVLSSPADNVPRTPAQHLPVGDKRRLSSSPNGSMREPVSPSKKSRTVSPSIAMARAPKAIKFRGVTYYLPSSLPGPDMREFNTPSSHLGGGDSGAASAVSLFSSINVSAAGNDNSFFDNLDMDLLDNLDVIPALRPVSPVQNDRGTLKSTTHHSSSPIRPPGVPSQCMATSHPISPVQNDSGTLKSTTHHSSSPIWPPGVPSQRMATLHPFSPVQKDRGTLKSTAHYSSSPIRPPGVPSQRMAKIEAALHSSPSDLGDTPSLTSPARPTPARLANISRALRGSMSACAVSSNVDSLPHFSCPDAPNLVGDPPFSTRKSPALASSPIVSVAEDGAPLFDDAQLGDTGCLQAHLFDPVLRGSYRFVKNLIMPVIFPQMSSAVPCDDQHWRSLSEVYHTLSRAKKRSILTTLLFTNHGVFINPSRADPSTVVHVSTGKNSIRMSPSGPWSAQRYPAIYLTTGVVDFCHLYNVEPAIFSTGQRRITREIGLRGFQQEAQRQLAFHAISLGFSTAALSASEGVITYSSMVQFENQVKDNPNDFAPTDKLKRNPPPPSYCEDSKQLDSFTFVRVPLPFTSPVPIYDGRSMTGTTAFECTKNQLLKLGSYSYPLYMNGQVDLPADSIITVGYSAQTYNTKHHYSDVSLGVSFDVAFVILLALPRSGQSGLGSTFTTVPSTAGRSSQKQSARNASSSSDSSGSLPPWYAVSSCAFEKSRQGSVSPVFNFTGGSVGRASCGGGEVTVEVSDDDIEFLA